MAVIVHTVATGAIFRLKDGSCTLGADPSCDVTLAHDTVSRTHAELTLVAEGVRVRDLGSRNGTFYLGQRIEHATVAPGTRLELGAAEIFIEPDHQTLFDDLSYEHDSYGALLGRSPAMRRLFALLARLEGSLVPVMVRGESGVGKELVARAIHDGSAVAAAPFVAINCGAIARELVGSELFGHVRGAFSGAAQDRLGALRSADGGTLFLDEVGELPLELQPTLLRALELGEVKPLGSDAVVHVKVRLVTATNRDLLQMCTEGTFRSDLFYRIAVVALTVPPLRERRDDVAVLANHFATLAGGELPAELLEQLKAQPWPGNVRELRNAVDAFAALRLYPTPPTPTAGAMATALAPFIDSERPYLEQRDALVDEFSRLYLSTLLARAGGNQTTAAKLAGLDRKYLARLLARYGLRG
jgi:DNA-binding NtrC family response regulator